MGINESLNPCLGDRDVGVEDDILERQTPLYRCVLYVQVEGRNNQNNSSENYSETDRRLEAVLTPNILG